MTIQSRNPQACEERRNLRFGLLLVFFFLVCLFLLLMPRTSRAATAPTEYEAYTRMIALRDQYPEGTPWENSSKYKYTWKGGIFTSGTGCAGFAFMLSDAAFGSLPARRSYDITFDDLRVGDILRIKNNTHSVVVMEHYSDCIVVAEGNFGPASNKIVHWGRTFTREQVEEVGTYYMTRYPEGPVHPDSGKYSTGITWSYAEGTLTVSGTGPIPSMRSEMNGGCLEPPWAHRRSEIVTLRIDSGITEVEYGVFMYLGQLRTIIAEGTIERIGENAFWGCDEIRAVVSFGRWPGYRGFDNSGIPIYGCMRGMLRLPESLTVIVAEAFAGVEYTVIRLPDNIQDIDASAFSDSVVLCCRAGTAAEAWCETLNLDYFTE